MDATDYVILCYVLSGVFVCGLAGYAFAKGYVLRRKINNSVSFLTARNQVGPLRIGWSFFAGALGAWVIASPANYASYAGMLGLVFYSLASGLPFIMIAFAGNKITSKLPDVLSLTDYIGWRFGLAAKTYVLVIVLFNMSIALLAEYVTIGSIFKHFVGTFGFPVVIFVGLITTAYTAYGGLLVSIYTDQIQGAFSLLFFLILGIYMAATFRPASLPTPMPCGPTDYYCISGTPNCGAYDAYNVENANTTDFVPAICPTSGYSAIFVMPASLFTATVFSEAMWQRAWASRDSRTLHTGAILGCTGVVFVVFFAGLCGLLAAWAGLITETTDPNLYLFQVLDGGQIPDPQTVHNWIGVFLVILATVMNTGAVDSIQNGMAAAVTSYISPMYKKWTLTMTRGVVLVLNLILISIAIVLVVIEVKVTVLQLFLMANMLACSSAIPVLLGVADFLHPLVGGGSFLFSCLFSIFCTCVYGVTYFNNTYTAADYPDGYTDYTGYTYYPGSFNSGMYYTWIGNSYAWQFFLIPICVSLGSMMLCAAFFFVAAKFKNYRQPAVLGFVAPATHPERFPAVEGMVTQPSLDSEGKVLETGSSGSDGELTPAATAAAISKLGDSPMVA